MKRMLAFILLFVNCQLSIVFEVKCNDCFSSKYIFKCSWKRKENYEVGASLKQEILTFDKPGAISGSKEVRGESNANRS